MDLNMQKRRARIRRQAVIAAAGLGLLCGAYLLPRAAQAVTRKADPLSLKAAAKAKAKAKLAIKPKALLKPVALLRPVAKPSLVVVPQQVAARTPSKPPPPIAGYQRSGPPAGLSFY
jgi:hypothetical protein